MKNPIPDHVIGIPVSSVSYTVEDSAGRTTSLSETANSYFLSTPSKESTISKQYRVKTSIEWINKVGKKADNFRQHVRLGSKVSATVKGKLRLGARILQEGGLEKLFKQIFNVGAEEKLLNAFQCYLSTTAGPVAGLLFISTERLAFCSERPLTFTLPTGKLFRTPYKVMIPLKKIKVANQSENVNKPSQKYIQVVTVDKFEFWFMGFLKYQKAFKTKGWNQRLISSQLSREEVQDIIAIGYNEAFLEGQHPYHIITSVRNYDFREFSTPNHRGLMWFPQSVRTEQISHSENVPNHRGIKWFPQSVRTEQISHSENVYSLQKYGASWLQKRSAMFQGDLS
ncbi:hypothetical protein NE237_006417 [Protea cynaroides]|uniref:GRAM domain-containing protein n=1 Tax=Protea cynaroides TaxID=273540 RepID=A0A9Q0QVA3_9MAGN|nr:hypothetical protein NE237_006417 [Protea cynaroides]